MLRQLANSCVLHGRILSTDAKIRVVQPIVERAITVAKANTLQARRQLHRTFTETAVKILLKDLGPKYKERAGGYTRRTLVNQRQGDAARQAILEFI
jgi:large subunit ribosomal protein L17